MTVVLPIVLWFAAICMTAPPIPSESPATPLVDNQRITTWDVSSPSQPMRHEHDFITVYVTGGTFQITRPDGTSVTASKNTGDVEFDAKGTMYRAIQPHGARRIEIELKDHAVAPLANTSGYPDAFPREGVKKVLDNDRVTIWDVVWLPGKATPMHFHGKDAIAVYLERGALKATTLDGQSVVNEYVPGFTKFNPRNRIHSEELARGDRERAIVIDLK